MASPRLTRRARGPTNFRYHRRPPFRLATARHLLSNLRIQLYRHHFGGFGCQMTHVAQRIVRRGIVGALCLVGLSVAAGITTGAPTTSPSPKSGQPASSPVKPVTDPAPSTAMPAEHVLAPDFELKDLDGKVHRLSDFRGHPVALHFFCDCDYCHRYARFWGQLQREGALPTCADGTTPTTLVVFGDDPDIAKKFIVETGLDPAQTIMCPDTPSGSQPMHVTDEVYHSEPCPRPFIVDAKGMIVYCNIHKDDLPQKAKEEFIATRALDALRKAVASPAGETQAVSEPHRSQG
jgi:hypothetical protein